MIAESLVGSAALDQVRAVLQGQRHAGVLVLGGPGSGKRTLVRHALETTGTDREVLTVPCSRSLSGVPYAALSPLLTELATLDQPVEVMRALQRRLARRPDEDPDQGATGPNNGTRPPVVVVEDAHFLDPASAFVLAQLVQNRACVLVAISSGPLHEDSGLAALSGAGVMVTTVVEPVSLGQLREHCAHSLGAPVTEGTLRTLWGMTGGNPRLITAFLQSARAQGVLVPAPQGPPEEGLPTPWILLRPGPIPDHLLHDAVEIMQANLTVPQRDTLRTVALAGSLPRARLQQIVGDQGCALTQIGMLRDGRDGRVAVAAHVLAEIVVSTTGLGASVALHDRWEAHGGRTDRWVSARPCLWSIECGHPASSEDLALVGRLAQATEDTPSGQSLGPLMADPTDEQLSVVRAEVQLDVGRLRVARAELDALAAEVQDPALADEALLALALDRVRSGDAPSIWEALDQELTRHRTRRPHPDGGDSPDGGDGHPPGLAAAVRLVCEPGRLEPTERLDCARALAVAPQAPSPAPSLEKALGQVAYAVVAGQTGRCVEAQVAADQAGELIETEPGLQARLGLVGVWARVGTALLAGDLRQAGAVLAGQKDLPPRLWYERSGTILALHGILALLRGRTDEAIGHLRDSVVELRYADPLQSLPLAEAALGYTTAVTGQALARRTASVGTYARLSAEGRGGPRPLWHLALGLARLADEVAAPDRDTGPGHETCAGAGAGPALPLALERELLWFTLLARPAAGSGEAPLDPHMLRLLEVCRSTDGHRSAVLALVVDPAHEDDPVALARVASEALTAHDPVAAAYAWARVVMIHHRARDQRRRGEALRRLAALQLTHGPCPSRFVREALALGELTQREREIVDMAAEGMTNAQIAEQLVLSQRTVEGHLYRVFTKWGITERGELRGL